tara:strand:- start:343 stop:468 length:126 start_codon:yes stop_codon:yes gene_type:complete
MNIDVHFTMLKINDVDIGNPTRVSDVDFTIEVNTNEAGFNH